jgi:oxygen-independent coproporphyrinogen-3 oxidase
MINAKFGIYLHLPFCLRRCAYCNFFPSEGRRRMIPSFMRGLVREIETVGRTGNGPSTAGLYFGGGSPDDLLSSVRGVLPDRR